jgi:hypothetical protein
MPVRKIPRNYRNATGIIATDKSDEPTAYESRLEHDCQKLIGFNLNVKKYEEQPVKITYFNDGKEHTYTPDTLVTYHNNSSSTYSTYWKPLLVEVKWRDILFDDWHSIKPKVRAGRCHAKEMGWDFVILTDQEINTPYLDNAILLLEHRNYPVNDDDTELLREALRHSGEIDVESLMRLIATDKYRRAELLPVVWKLVANFEVTTNLEVLLSMRTRLSLEARDEEERDERLHRYSAGHARQLRWRALRYFARPES